MSDIPKFEPLPNVGNVVSNRVTSFNQGYNLYQCINYLQGYVSIVYENMDALLDDWNNFQQVINENIDKIATEETQRILNEWLSDGTLNELISQNPLWDQKLDKSGGTMTGNIKFSENTKIVGTTPGGNDIDLIHNTNDGASGNYVKFGDPNAKSVVNSKQQPVWHDGQNDYNLTTQKQLDEGLGSKLNKSGGTITGDLKLLEKLLLNNRVALSFLSGTLIFGNDTTPLEIHGSNKPVISVGDEPNSPIIVASDVVDNLNSSAKQAPLSANQGRVLNKAFGNITRMHAGSAIRSMDSTGSTMLFTNDEIKNILNATTVDNTNTAVFVSNGDREAYAVNLWCSGCMDYSDGKGRNWWVYAGDSKAGQCRINYLIVYWGSVS